jgi:hypothetical protein
MTAEVALRVELARLDEPEARRLTDDVNADAKALWRILRAEIGRSQAYRLLDAGHAAAAIPRLGNEGQPRGPVPFHGDRLDDRTNRPDVERTLLALSEAA